MQESYPQQKVSILGSFTTLNEYIDAERGNKYAGSKIKKEETERVTWQTKNITKLKPPYRIHFHWVVPNRKCDPDNIAFAKKYILDGLVNSKVIDGDSFKYICALSDSFEVGKPRVDIFIS